MRYLQTWQANCQYGRDLVGALVQDPSLKAVIWNLEVCTFKSHRITLAPFILRLTISIVNGN